MKPMFARNQISILFIVLLFGLSACSPSAKSPANANSSIVPGTPTTTSAPATSLKYVKAIVSEAQLSAGGSGEAIVHLTVQSGYHVNANPPTYPYLRATELTIPVGENLSVGFITYPTAISKKFSFAEKPLAVYEGEVPIKVMLKAAARTTKGPHTLAAKLNVQACDDQVCYPPGTLELLIPVTIK